MRNRWMGLVLVGALLVGVPFHKASAAFTQMFQVGDVKGDCSAQTGDASKVLKGGEGFPYGTTLRTPADGSLTIVLGPDSKILVGPNAVVAMGEDSSGGRQKIVGLHRGKIDLDLAKEFQTEGALQIATRCVVVNVLVGGSSSVEATKEADLNVVVITARSGQLDAAGPDFMIPLLKDNDSIAIACSQDRQFIRLRCLAGKFGVQIKDSAGNERIAEMVTDSVIKILRKRSDASGDTWIVTILEVAPDGSVVQADSLPPEAGGDEPPLLDGEEPPPTEEGDEPDQGDPEGTFPTTSSSTTTSTSTTSIPPGDTTTTQPPPPTTTKPPVTPTGRR